MGTILQRKRPGRRGYILIVVMFIILITSMMGITTARVMSSALREVMSKYHKMQALYNARRGLYEVIYAYMNNPAKPYVSLTAVNGYGVSPGSRFEVGTRQSDLFLVSTARVRRRKDGATANYWVRGIQVANLDAGNSKTISSIRFDFVPDIGSITAGNIFGEAITTAIGSGGTVSPGKTILAKEFVTNAMALYFNCKPTMVVATFTFDDNSTMKMILYQYHVDDPRGVREMTRNMYNYFTITSTGSAFDSVGREYKRTLVGAYDVSYSRLRFLKEIAGHLY